MLRGVEHIQLLNQLKGVDQLKAVNCKSYFLYEFVVTFKQQQHDASEQFSYLTVQYVCADVYSIVPTALKHELVFIFIRGSFSINFLFCKKKFFSSLDKMTSRDDENFFSNPTARKAAGVMGERVRCQSAKHLCQPNIDVITDVQNSTYAEYAELLEIFSLVTLLPSETFFRTSFFF